MQGIARRLLYVLLVVVSLAAMAGTPHLILDINTERVARDSNPVYLGKLGNSFYFIANDVPGGAHAALFKTDGTESGTTKVQDIGNGGISTNGGYFRPPYQKPTLFLSTGTKAYFVAFQFTTGQEVWVTDGTEGGTHMVADVFPGAGGDPLLLGLVGSELVFYESVSDQVRQIIKTDGTAAGTSVLANFSASTGGIVNESVVANGKVYISIDSDLWVTDGTAT